MRTLKQIFDQTDFDVVSKSDMDKVNCLMDTFVEQVRQQYPDVVNNMLMEVSMLLMGDYMNEHVAKHLVSKFKNKDNTTGGHWDWETTLAVKPDTIESQADWYYMLNKVYCKLYVAGKTDAEYIDDAKDILTMFDGKAKMYHLSMH